MKTMTFLAGVATGVLLQHYMNRAGVAHEPHAARTGDAAPLRPATVTTGSERDEPTHAPPRSDEELRERICAHLGRTISDPDAIQVEVAGGCVTLRGRVPARDSVLLMTVVENMPGVQSVRNQAQIEGSLDDIAPPMTRDKPAVRAGERASSRMS